MLGTLAFAHAASAQLTGTSMDIVQEFTGTFATTTTGPHTYGGSTNYPDPNFAGFSWQATSPAPTPPAGFDNSIFCDYALFALGDFAGTTTTITISGIDVDVATSSARVINSNGTEIGTGTSGGQQIQFQLNVDDILAGPTDTMTVAWDNESTCYPDCNQSGTLTIADFGCFQAAFGAGNMYADCNASGTLTIADFACFQSRFAAGDPYADCNASGSLTIADFACFQAAFAAGCP